MSYQIPQRTIDALRQYTDVVIDAVGIPCTLYIPNESSYQEAEREDIFRKPADYEHDVFTCKVWIEWSPSTYRLKKAGIYTEESLPMLVWFPNTITDSGGNSVEADIGLRSYFSIDSQFIPAKYTKAEEFEIVNVALRGMHDKVALKAFAAAPRRVKK